MGAPGKDLDLGTCLAVVDRCLITLTATGWVCSCGFRCGVGFGYVCYCCKHLRSFHRAVRAFVLKHIKYDSMRAWEHYGFKVSTRSTNSFVISLSGFLDVQIERSLAATTQVLAAVPENLFQSDNYDAHVTTAVVKIIQNVLVYL